MEAVRRLTAPPKQRRFYERVEMRLEDAGYALTLDGRRAMTPARRPLVVPKNLADAVAAEWEAQSAEIDPSSMPVTRLANTAIDGVAARLHEVRQDVLAYAGTDLLCYRATEPDELVRRQDAAWNPILAWAEKRFGVRFALAAGLVHVAQPQETQTALAAALAGLDDPFRLAGLHLATTLTGSALIALALAEGAVDVDGAWAAAHVDEDWNISKWGEDSEAMARRAARFADFRAAALAVRGA
jgi:chaperone required for assembly of F1-ATPase